MRKFPIVGTMQGRPIFERMAEESSDPWKDRFRFGALLDHAATYRGLAEAVGAELVTIMPMEWLELDRPALEHGLARWLEIAPGQIDIANHQTANARKSGRLRWNLRASSLRNKLWWAVRRKPASIYPTRQTSRAVLDLSVRSDTELALATGLDLKPLVYVLD